MPRPKKPDPVRHCRHCGSVLLRQRINGRLEDRTVFMRRVYCDRACMAQAMTHAKPNRKAVQKRVLKYRKPSCEQCGSTENLCIHHRDRNWRNNHPSNLMTLCSSCHTSLHHQHGHLVQKKEKPPCSVCGKPSYRRGLCNTHLTRFKRYGNPCLKRKKIGRSWQLVEDIGSWNGRLSQESQQA